MLFLKLYFNNFSVFFIKKKNIDNRFQRRRQAAMRHKMLLEQEVQLSRLRQTEDSALTNFNPNYGCDGILNGGNVDVKSLPQVARESLRLVK